MLLSSIVTQYLDFSCTFSLVGHIVKTGLILFCILGMDGGHQKVLWQTSQHEPWRARCKTAQEFGSDCRRGAQTELQQSFTSLLHDFLE